MRASAIPFYYGWLVLAASAVAELLAQGATSYSAGLFVLPLQAEFHLSRADANSGIIILFLGSALMSPLVGRLLDRWPVRLVVSLGAVLFGAALLVIASATSLWVMALALLIPGAAGFMAIGPLNTSTLASRWFRRRRGLALGIAAIATSAGGLVVTPLVARAIAQHGWRDGLRYEALAIAAIIIVLGLLVLRDSPAQVGLAEHPENTGAADDRPVMRDRRFNLLASRDFWTPALGLVTISGICQALVVTLVPYAVQMGVSAVAAALYVSAFAAAAAVTKIVAGLLADRIRPVLLMPVACLFMVLVQAMLLFVPSQAGLLVASCLAGIALGWVLPVSAALIARSFGPAAFGSVMGWVYAFLLVIAIAATRYVGAVYDRTHGYTAAFTTFLVLAVVVLLATLFLGRRTA